MLAIAKMSAVAVFLLVVETSPSCTNQTSRPRQPTIIAEYSVPGSADFFSMTAGPDGALWFTDIRANAIDRIELASQVLKRFSLPKPFGNPMGIAVGSDGALWFAEEGTS